MDVNLPAPEIFEIIVNPSNYDVFVEDGKWSHDEITAVVMEAKDKIQADAIKMAFWILLTIQLLRI